MVDRSHSRRFRLAPQTGVIFFLILIALPLVVCWSSAEAHSLPPATPPFTSGGLAAGWQAADSPPVGMLSCPASSSARWGQMAPRQSYITRAAQSPDLNLYIRGWYPVDEPLRFSAYAYPHGEPPDHQYPLYLSSVVPGSTVSSFVATYQVNNWDWRGCKCATARQPLPYPVTMLGLRTTPGQPIYAPTRDRPIDPRGFTAMVLYADANQVALKYTWEDRIDTGYLVHLVNLCVDPNLVALYDRLNREGRHALPALHNGSAVGVAAGGEVDVLVRDSGDFMDPRSWQDWWQDQPPPLAAANKPGQNRGVPVGSGLRGVGVQYCDWEMTSKPHYHHVRGPFSLLLMIAAPV